MIDLLIHNASQLITCASPTGPKRGRAMQDLGIIEEGAVAIHDGRIIAVGPTQQLQRQYTAHQTLNANGQALCPGFVDPHTHTIFGGDRAHEFELRIQGATYMEIMAAGGGILNTMKKTRSATIEQLAAQASQWLDEMIALGTTTVEIKTGYGLDMATELKMLETIAQLDQTHTCDLIPTFLGAHTVPPEFENNSDGYVQHIIKEMLPAVVQWYQHSHFAQQQTPFFIDVFCEDHAFTLTQSRRLLQAGLNAGLQAKIHVDQFNSFGGVTMAAELGLTSVDHLDVTETAEIDTLAQTNTIAVPLPAVNFNLAASRYANARAMLDAGAAVALATDFNPGSAPCLAMPNVMAIACRYQKLTPAEALNASTINAAHAINLGHQLGSLEVGKQADILHLKASDYRHLAYIFGHNPIATVIKKGKIL